MALAPRLPVSEHSGNDRAQYFASSLMRDSLLQVSHTPTVTVSGRDSRCASDSSIKIHPNLRKSGGRDSVQEGGEVKPARPEHTRTPDNRTKKACRCSCKSFVALPVLLQKAIIKLPSSLPSKVVVKHHAGLLLLCRHELLTTTQPPTGGQLPEVIRWGDRGSYFQVLAHFE